MAPTTSCRRPTRCLSLAAVMAVAVVMLSLHVQQGVAVRVVNDTTLPRLNIAAGMLTTSGVSGGGAAATQFHVSYSESIGGCGIIAGPPYYCAQANIDIALNQCMKDPALISVEELINFAKYAADTLNSVDSVNNLKDDRVWIFTGEKDTVVHPGVVDKTFSFYKHWIKDPASVLIGSYPAEHAWVTDSYGNNCTYLGSPYINNCGFDAAGSMLQHLYNYSLANRSTEAAAGTFIQFEQLHYTPPGTLPPEMSLGNMGYLYVPPNCADKQTPCKLHVVFHGCNQDLESVGDDFVMHSGLTAWADTNDIVVLYPQAKKSDEIPYNPQGCFDWWGYSGVDYACKFGLQMQTFANMVKAVAGFV